MSVKARRLERSQGPSGVARLIRLLPGVVAAALIMVLALPLAGWIGGWLLRLQGVDPESASSPVSGVPVAILLGILARNLLPLPQSLNPGIQFARKAVLQLGIVLVGVKLSLFEVVRLGLWGIPIVAVCIAAGLVLVIGFNTRLGLPFRLGTLIAAGTGICGVTAIVSVAPAIEADEKEVAYAVANVTLFGLIGMLAYPYLAPLLFDTPEQVGLWLGVAVHDTSQVVGAALTYREVFGDDTAFQVATVTKLTRNLFLIAVIPLLSLYYFRSGKGAARRSGARLRLSQLVPTFILGFLLMALLRTLGDATAAAGGAAFGLWSLETWSSLVAALGDVWGAKYLLGTALAAVGLGTHFSVFRGVGFKPFLVGLVGAVLVGVVGMIMVFSLGGLVRL